MIDRIGKVLMTADTVGGVWAFALELAEALEPVGTEVLLACLGGRPTADQRAAAARLPNVVLAESDYKLEWMREPWADVARSGDWLLGMADRFEPDVVHLNSFGHGALPWAAPVVLTAHSCVLSWWTAVRGGTAPVEWDRYRELVVRSLASVDLVTAPSEAMLGSLRCHYRAPLVPAMVIPNARRADRYRQGPKEPIVLAAARLWDEAKNIAAVARVAPRLTWPCAIAGEALHPDGSRARFDGCTMLGHLAADALAGWYARASIYALPALYEPFGLSALEAALSGCALVLGDIESLREVWGDAAVFVPPDEEEALAAALAALIADPRRRAQLAARGCESARRFTPAKLAEGYRAAYRAAIGTRRPACVS